MPDVALGLKQLLAYEGDVQEDLGVNFQVTSDLWEYSWKRCPLIIGLFQVSVDEFGKLHTHELKPGGENIPVTNENRQGNHSTTLPALIDTFMAYRICWFVHGTNNEQSHMSSI